MHIEQRVFPINQRINKNGSRQMNPTLTRNDEQAHPAPTRGVLVIDDDAIQRDWLSRILARAGQSHVFTAADGTEALEFLRDNAERIGLIVCDLQMPGLDGMALLRRIGESGYKPAVIISSASDSAILRSVELMVKAVGLTVLGSLPKPVKPAMLERLLKIYQQAAPVVAGAAAIELTPADVDRGLAAGEFVPYFQPKVDLITSAFAGVEALARWIHPVHGVLRPAAFLPMIESHGKMERLTQAIAAGAITAAADWKKRGCKLTLNINLSLSALDNHYFCEDIQSLLTAVGLEPGDVTFEVLETAAIADVGRTLETMARLRLNGFGLSIDDFGTGFSSLEQLSSIPFTELKIDRSFVNGASHTPRLAAVVRSCIDLAHRLHLRVVAEGVETQEDWQFLAGAGANEAQGYFIAQPMPGDQVLAFADRWTAAAERGPVFQTA